jgi:hypothetical protein
LIYCSTTSSLRALPGTKQKSVFSIRQAIAHPGISNPNMFLTRPISFFLVFSSVQLHLILASKIPLSSHPNPAGLLLARDTDSQTASAEFTKDDVFQKAVLSVTNTYRKRHNATGLKWNETLAETAGKWSGRCVFEHSVCVFEVLFWSVVWVVLSFNGCLTTIHVTDNLTQGGSTGETLSSGYPNTTASLVTWGQESTKYDFKKGQFTKETGHFTQLVWKATTAVGCSRTQCDGKGGGKARGWFVVCEYYPARNGMWAAFRVCLMN